MNIATELTFYEMNIATVLRLLRNEHSNRVDFLRNEHSNRVDILGNEHCNSVDFILALPKLWGFIISTPLLLNVPYTDIKFKENSWVRETPSIVAVFVSLV
ncbi:hypothetical protein BgiBS90_028761 [Biomphalaria glabrata]|nr:hypothetical protein BgiBS90_028761 [Biomphalaria glabrata]